MEYGRLFRIMSDKTKEQIQKVIDTLKMGGRSKRTIDNYVHAIYRFIKYFENNDISKLNENDIAKYIRNKYLVKNCSSNTYNMNICAIKYFYSIIYNKDFNRNLLPHARIKKKIPTVITRETFIKIFDEELDLKRKCWLLLAYSSGLRADEIARLKIENINSKEHQLKVYGKRKKERITVLPDITIHYLRLYYKTTRYFSSIPKKGYLFKGYSYAEHINSGSITNYFTGLKKYYGLDENISFHSLRHSFASNFIRNNGDPFVLKSMMGHTSMSTTSIYIHMGRDFNNLKGVNYDGI